MHEDLLYISFSILTAALGVFSAITATRAMYRGLTYSVMHAVGILLAVIALSNIWHVIREAFGIEEEWAEFVEYGMRSLGYIYFIGVAYRASRVRNPSENKK